MEHPPHPAVLVISLAPQSLDDFESTTFRIPYRSQYVWPWWRWGGKSVMVVKYRLIEDPAA
jgi:hypothetical protein